MDKWIKTKNNTKLNLSDIPVLKSDLEEILPDEIIYSFIKLEPLFSKNISFYWSLWNIFSFQKFGKIEDGKKALEIISVLAPKSDYGTQAKTLLQEL